MGTSAVYRIFILLFLLEDLLAELSKYINSFLQATVSAITLNMFQFFFSMSRNCEEGTSGGHGVKTSRLGAGV